MINTEADTIHTTIEPIYDPNDLEGYEERIDALIIQEKDILSSLQMNVTLEEESNNTTTYTGGNKKRLTRKFPKNSIINYY
jgi:hypothetical protein